MSSPAATSPRPLAVTVALGLLAGAAATWAKGKAEGTLQPLGERLRPPTAAQRLIPGANPAEHPELMPPTLVVDRVVELTSGGIPSQATQVRYSRYVHLGMGLGSGVAYALLARRSPAVRAGLGIPAGLGLYAGTHGSLLPATGFHPYPWGMPPAVLVWEGGSHAVYGAALELSLRFADLLGRHPGA